MEPFILKERCSALGHLMVGAELSGQPIPLSKADQDRLNLIQGKKDCGEKLTEAMERDYPELIKRLDAKVKPILSTGAKTHIRNKWYGDYFDYQKHAVSKYTKNGHEQEDGALQEVARMLGYTFAFKNTLWKENDFIHGTCDWLPKEFVLDIKNVFEPSGLDLGDLLDKIYEWQIKGYCWLYGRDHGLVTKVLRNKSVGILMQQCKTLWIDADPLNNSYNDQIPEEFVQEVFRLYDFESRLPIEERCHFYHVELFQRDIDLIKQQVELARDEYYKLKSPSHFNKEIIERFKKVA